jgi:cob(I)alamin adenosyltransferase
MARHSKRNPIGFTDIIGASGISKSDPRIHTNGAIDEASAALGMARAFMTDKEHADVLKQCQADLSKMMGFIAAVNTEQTYFVIEDSFFEKELELLESYLFKLEAETKFPNVFVYPGDIAAEAALNMARTIVRRAERETVAFFTKEDLKQKAVLQYLNRLSSLCYIFGLLEAEE